MFMMMLQILRMYDRCCRDYSTSDDREIEIKIHEDENKFVQLSFDF